MQKFLLRLALLPAAAFLALVSGAVAQTQSTADPERPVTPPDSYRVVMENERVRIIEVHIKAHSKVNVDSPPGRDRFLYMLSDGALILAAPGKAPYEFAMHAGETAVFPAISPVVENDTDAPVRALMVEIKDGGRTVASAKLKGKYAGKRGARGKFAAKSSGKSKSVKSAKATSRTATSKSTARSPAKSKQAAKPRKPQAAVRSGVKPPLNLSKANAKPAKKVTGRSRGSDS
jgi:quercetin dioxygenase-like cupin family protein